MMDTGGKLTIADEIAKLSKLSVHTSCHAGHWVKNCDGKTSKVEFISKTLPEGIAESPNFKIPRSVKKHTVFDAFDCHVYHAAAGVRSWLELL